MLITLLTMENITDAGLVLFHNSFSKRGLLDSAMAAAETTSSFVLSIEERTFYKAYYYAAVVAKLNSEAAEAYAKQVLEQSNFI
jgi:precorrin-4 methylase